MSNITMQRSADRSVRMTSPRRSRPLMVALGVLLALFTDCLRSEPFAMSPR